MDPEELRSKNARPARADIEANSTDYGMVEGDKGLETKRHERSEGNSEKKTVIVFSDTDTIITWQDTITKHKSLEVLVISLFYAEDFIREHAAYSFSAIIICHSVKSENSLSHPESCFKICCEKFGHEKVYMVIIDLEDTKTAKKVEEEWSTGKYACCQLLTLTRAELDGIKSPLRIERLEKIKALRQILLNAKDISSKWKFNQPKLQIGIFSRSDQEDYSWLVYLLRSDIFSDLVKYVRPYDISNRFQQFKNDVKQCTFTILYHTKTRGRINITDMGESSLYDKELEYLHEQLGQNRVIVVIDDLRDSSDQEKTRIIQEQPSIGRLAKDLLLFSKEEKESNYVTCLPSFQEKMRKLDAMMFNGDLEYKGRKEKGLDMEISWGQNLPNHSRDENSAAKPAGGIHSTHEYKGRKEKGLDMEISWGQNLPNHSRDENSAAKPAGGIHSTHGPVPNFLSQISKKHVVGFFSSSSEEDYGWLMAIANRHAKQVYACYIGNSGFHHFIRDVRQCTFGILYHTMTRGRINITDVKDAIYDRHLEYMSSHLKKNVIVVIDDVVDSSDQEKTRILETQPSIRRLARKLILISKQDKMMCGDLICGDDTKTCRLS